MLTGSFANGALCPPPTFQTFRRPLPSQTRSAQGSTPSRDGSNPTPRDSMPSIVGKKALPESYAPQAFPRLAHTRRWLTVVGKDHHLQTIVRDSLDRHYLKHFNPFPIPQTSFTSPDPHDISSLVCLSLASSPPTWVYSPWSKTARHQNVSTTGESTSPLPSLALLP